MRVLVIMLLLFIGAAPQVGADERDSFLELARRGWNYELRTTMIGRDLSIPVHINGRDLAGSTLCLVGDPPHAQSLETLDAFRDLMRQTFGKPLTMRHAGPDARLCGSGRTVVLRFYSGHPPHRDMSQDIIWMDQTYQLGLPTRRGFMAGSPAMAQTFFGRRGQSTHIMVQQAGKAEPDPLETLFFRSILIEELFQSFSFGMDLLQFDAAAPFLSKLQEIPSDLRRLPWGSPDFMRGLVLSNPTGLCTFDVFMLLAIARSPVDQTTEPDFLTFIGTEYDALLRDARVTMADPRFAAIIDPGCQRGQIRGG